MDVARISRYLHNLKADSWDVFDLAVIDADGHVIASTDTPPASTEPLAALLPKLLAQALTVSGLNGRGEAEAVYLKFEDAYLVGVPIIAPYFYVIEAKPNVKFGPPTPASPHLAHPYLREMLDERISRYLNDLKATSPDVFNLAVIGTDGRVMASTDPDPARTERLAAWLPDLVWHSSILSNLTKREGVYTVTLNFENACLVLAGIGRWYGNNYIYVMELKGDVKSRQSTPASTDMALPMLHAILIEDYSGVSRRSDKTAGNFHSLWRILRPPP